ncbi:hypothetical protein F5887DRAFT_972155 [Amanita rubescens]|nr:hypothetical protein F5887DRAFT_972155 [Amanita rubescens]
MLSFYALLFLLFSTSSVAVPIGGHVATGTNPHISLPANNAADGYWVLKKPSREHYFYDTVLKIEHEELSTFELNKDFKIVPESKRVVEGHDKPYLAGVWHKVPLRGNPASDRFKELIFFEQDNTITTKLSATDASKLKQLPYPSGSHTLSQSSLPAANGYWVLGDAIETGPVETWRKILHIDSGRFSTFELDDKFNIIDRKNANGPLPGDYFRIPFQKMDLFYRFAVLRAREVKVEGKAHALVRVQYLDTDPGSDSE